MRAGMDLPAAVLQWGHGREAMDGLDLTMTCRTTMNFNGAMAVRPWMAPRRSLGLAPAGGLQWGHGREAMNGMVKFSNEMVAYKLQWGHGREAMDGSPGRKLRRRRLRLQWGHGREAMDGSPGRKLRRRRLRLQWGHGREAMDGSSIRSSWRSREDFNGAMAVRPWMARCSARSPWPSGDFNGAMAVRPWMVPTDLDTVGARMALQWGHGREAMDGFQAGLGAVGKPKLQWGHGREAMDGGAPDWIMPASSDFNGAMAVRPWMARRGTRRHGTRRDFNGAMAVRPWMERSNRNADSQTPTSMGPWP